MCSTAVFSVIVCTLVKNSLRQLQWQWFRFVSLYLLGSVSKFKRWAEMTATHRDSTVKAAGADINSKHSMGRTSWCLSGSSFNCHQAKVLQVVDTSSFCLNPHAGVSVMQQHAVCLHFTAIFLNLTTLQPYSQWLPLLFSSSFAI